jgi:nicotinate-nucleotide pyrophosphorylase (carboxylating)
MNAIEKLIDQALEEDIGPADITTESLVPVDLVGSGEIVAKESVVLAGLDISRKVFERLDPDISWKPRYRDGEAAVDGATVVELFGRLGALLSAERVALNFLQRLSGIATLTRTYSDKLGSSNVRLVDTRKTTPGWRALEKYAVRVGGANNHRMGLYDGVLIKDNHIAACGGIKTAVACVRQRISHLMKIEVEVTTLGEAREALEVGVDIIMLDNMTPLKIREAVALINKRAVVEVSGGITDITLEELAKTGVDIISVGALTHSARSVDLSMRISASNI